MTTSAAQIASGLSAEEVAALEHECANADTEMILYLRKLGLIEATHKGFEYTDLGREVLAVLEDQPAPAAEIDTSQTISIEKLKERWDKSNREGIVRNLVHDLSINNTAANDEVIEILRLQEAELATLRQQVAELRELAGRAAYVKGQQSGTE